MKVDCHCHILPGLDDGAQTLEDSVFLAGKLVEWGYQRAVCTAHSSSETLEGMYEWLGTDLHKKKYSDFFNQFVFGKR